ncbi:hypothetical protein DYB36_003789 [Aphanomyces astaci]|uniref:EF-hand domain-containing protein n=1 Tax=Aphanomyces astaci TaxID=112090 RepID=A0A397AMJ3_APHAT|nr:hypothetical protein DYB36_003789 [Aphanomyces astaci]
MWVDMTLIAVTSLSDVPLPPGHDLLGPVSPVDRLTAKSPKHATFVDPKKDLKRVRSVGFEGADIVEFEPTIFTTTVTSGGVPNYMEEGYLDPDERATILGNAGCEASSFETVEAELNLIIAHRKESNEMDVQCIYGLGEYGAEDDIHLSAYDDDASDDNDDDDGGPSPFHCTYFATTADTTHEWKQTLDIIARTDGMEEGGVWHNPFRPSPEHADRCPSTKDDTWMDSDALTACSSVSTACEENYSDLDLSSTDVGDVSVLMYRKDVPFAAHKLVTRRKPRQELSDEQRKELVEAFDMFDTNKSGSVDYYELKVRTWTAAHTSTYRGSTYQVMMRALGFDVKKQEVVKMVEEVDVHRSGRVHLDDFMEISTLLSMEKAWEPHSHSACFAVRRKITSRDPDEEIIKAFTLFDDDQTGEITLKVMTDVRRTAGASVEIHIMQPIVTHGGMLQAMIDEFDSNQDGVISQDEFLAIMKQSSMY